MVFYNIFYIFAIPFLKFVYFYCRDDDWSSVSSKNGRTGSFAPTLYVEKIFMQFDNARCRFSLVYSSFLARAATIVSNIDLGTSS